MSKANQRRRWQAARAGIAQSLVDGWSATIAARLIALDVWRGSETVHTYIGALAGEVRTDRLIARALRERRRVICPVVRAHGQLEHRELTDVTALQPSAFGLLEPDAERAPPADAADADLIVVPGVAFSPAGARIGMGGGYYDRLLAEHDTAKVGLAFELQLHDDIVLSPHDELMDVIVTELRVIQCR